MIPGSVHSVQRRLPADRGLPVHPVHLLERVKLRMQSLQRPAELKKPYLGCAVSTTVTASLVAGGLRAWVVSRCPGQSKRTADEQCQECRAGFSLTVDHFCEPFICDEGPGSLCKRCLDLDMRTADDQCAECNAGYMLTEDFSCSSFKCATGAGPACKSCVDVAKATGNNQCTECNPGYELLADGTCRQYNCQVGNNHMCRGCADPKHRTGHNQCTACNDGYKLNTEGLCILSPCSSEGNSNCKVCGSGEECQRCQPGYQLTPSFACRLYECRKGGGGAKAQAMIAANLKRDSELHTSPLHCCFPCVKAAPFARAVDHCSREQLQISASLAIRASLWLAANASRLSAT